MDKTFATLQSKYCKLPLYAINSAKNILHRSHLKSLYYALVHPYLDYGVMLWGTALKRDTKPLNTLQKKAIRIINNANYNAHTTPLFKSSNILMFEDMYKLHICKFMYQCTKDALPSGLSGIFTANAHLHCHNTRQRYDPHVISKCTACAMQSVLHKGPQLWHKLPNTIKDTKTLHSFNKALKSHFITFY